MRKLSLIFALIIMAVFVFNLPAYARKGSNFKHADRNQDGTIDKKEWKMEQKWEEQHRVESLKSYEHKQQGAKVNTSLEAKYDSDGDGWLEPGEAREYLKSRYTLITTYGKAKVDSALEKQYDTDGDGIVDIKEAAALKEYLE